VIKIKIKDLSRAQIDWLVAKCEGWEYANDPAEHTDPEEALDEYNWWMRHPNSASEMFLSQLSYTGNINLMYPIMFREKISTLWRPEFDAYWACVGGDPGDEETMGMFGVTPVHAAALALAVHHLGDDVTEVEVPEELS
jgi:hypothetical protein